MCRGPFFTILVELEGQKRQSRWDMPCPNLSSSLWDSAWYWWSCQKKWIIYWRICDLTLTFIKTLTRCPISSQLSSDRGHKQKTRGWWQHSLLSALVKDIPTTFGIIILLKVVCVCFKSQGNFHLSDGFIQKEATAFCSRHEMSFNEQKRDCCLGVTLLMCGCYANESWSIYISIQSLDFLDLDPELLQVILVIFQIPAIFEQIADVTQIFRRTNSSQKVADFWPK